MEAVPWLRQVERRVTRWAGDSPGSGWVVAVSGGSDSVGLLRVLHALAPRIGLTLSVAHLDHGARGEAARDDAAFVAGLAATLGLPFDLGSWTPTRPTHFEADARAARYAWLLDTARARGASAVAVGHTRDDQAETVLHRVLRGTGPRGLAGIPARRPLGDGVTLVRPLLDVPRRALCDHLADLGQPFRDDATNADLNRTRARLRHDLLPRLEAEYNPRVVDALARLARLAGASYRAYERHVVEAERSATLEGNHDRVLLSRHKLMALPAFLRAEVIRLAWRRVGWPEAGMSEARWRRIAALVRRTRPDHFDVGGGVVAWPSPFMFELRRAAAPGYFNPKPVPSESLPLEMPGSAPWPGGRVVLTLDPDAPRDETVDLDRVFPPLWVRGPLPGDRFRPLGMVGRSMALNDFFRGRHVDRASRPLVPLVCDRFQIIWVVGHRIADRIKLTETTRRPGGLRWEAE